MAWSPLTRQHEDLNIARGWIYARLLYSERPTYTARLREAPMECLVGISAETYSVAQEVQTPPRNNFSFALSSICSVVFGHGQGGEATPPAFPEASPALGVAEEDY